MKRCRQTCSSGNRSAANAGAMLLVSSVSMVISALGTYNALVANAAGQPLTQWMIATTLPSMNVPIVASASDLRPDTPTREIVRTKHKPPERLPKPRSYVVAAGRSPIPQPGETIQRLIPARRLVTPQQDAPLAAPDVPVRWAYADRYVGQKITVSGRVISTRRTDSVCFLNFSEDWRGQFYVVIFKDALDNWPQPPEEYFLNQWVRVLGKVTVYQGRAQIRVQNPSQISIVR